MVRVGPVGPSPGHGEVKGDLGVAPVVDGSGQVHGGLDGEEGQG